MPDQSPGARYLVSDLRRAASLTQAQVAQRMGVTAKRVSQIEAAYPAVRYDTLVSYLQALGGHIRLTVKDLEINLDDIGADPDLESTRAWLKSSRKRGIARMQGEQSVAEELVLQGEQSGTGDDDTGRHVDQPDAQGDQGDSGQGQ